MESEIILLEFVVGTKCEKTICECILFDQKEITKENQQIMTPPVHDECDCYLISQEDLDKLSYAGRAGAKAGRIAADKMIGELNERTNRTQS